MTVDTDLPNRSAASASLPPSHGSADQALLVAVAELATSTTEELAERARAAIAPVLSHQALVLAHRAGVGVSRDPLQVAVYLSMFPQLVAGPIVRYNTIYRQLSARRATFDVWPFLWPLEIVRVAIERDRE